MFPRTRRCLTGTYPRPIVTARTSKFTHRFTVSPWCQRLPEPAPQVALLSHNGRPNPEADRAPLRDTTNTRIEAATDESAISYVTSRLSVRRLIHSRISKLPRAHVDLDEDFVPTYRTAREDLTSQDLAKRASKSHWVAPKPIEWLPLAQLLAKIPPAARQTTQEHNAVNTEKMHDYIGSSRPNTWTETVGAGVHVQLPSSPRSTSRPAILTGSEYYKGIVLDKFVEGDLEEAHIPGVFSDTLADDLNFVTSAATFTRFVFRLTNKFVNRKVENDLYHSYDRYAAELLCWMFTDPVISRFASTVALNRALIFLHNHTELLPAAELVFAEGQSRFLAQNITTLNLRLKLALRHSFDTMAYATAREMMHSEIQPNSRTWALIFTALPLRWERQELVKLIRQTNTHMTDNAWSQLASATLQEWLQRAGKDAQKFDNFVASLDVAFGSTWLDSHGVHHALQICIRRSLFHVARRLSELAEARGVAFSRDSHVDSFALFRRRMDIHAAIKLLTAMGRNGEVVHHKWVIPYMFMTAWDRQRTNICHLLWVFAATHGLITNTMRLVVTRALLYNTRSEVRLEHTSPSQLRRSTWQQLTARVICGIDEATISHGTDFGRCFPRLHAYVSRTSSEPLDIAEMLMKRTPDDVTRDEQLSLMYVMIGADNTAWKTFDKMPQDVLIEQLPLAVERDQQWALVPAFRNHPLVARRESRRALKDCIPKRASGEWSERLWRIRQVVLRNMEAAGLQPRTHTDATGVKYHSTRTSPRGQQEHPPDAPDEHGDSEASRPAEHETQKERVPDVVVKPDNDEALGPTDHETQQESEGNERREDTTLLSKTWKWLD